MNADEARAATAPGGPLEFVHAGGRIIVPVSSSTVEDQLRGAIFTAVVHDRPTLFDGPEGREAVLVSRARYAQAVVDEAELSSRLAACARVAAAAQARLAELAGSHGCEAAAETAREQGRMDAAREIAAAAARKEQS